MKILDSNHLVELEQDSALGKKLRQRLSAAHDELATTVVNVEEHLWGWLALINRSTDPYRQIPAYERLQRQVELFAKWTVLPFDRHGADLFRQCQRERIRVSTMDLKIACITIAHGATLLTRNTADFAKVPGLRFENWLD